jgi:carbon-monoxide dehydrogenase large subunit
MPKKQKYIGEAVSRIEDRRFLTGSGCFIDDVSRPDMAAMAILRSPHAHAHLRNVDCSSARALSGIIDIFTASDLGFEQPKIPIRLAPFKGFENFLQCPLAENKVRYVGEPVAVVIAEDRYLAEDALEAIVVDYDVIEPVVDIAQSALDTSLLHEEAGTNLATQYLVDRGDVDDVFSRAEYTRKEKFTTNRHAACPIETRGLVGIFDDEAQGLRLEGAVKVTWFNRKHLALAFGLPEKSVVLIEHDVGGGFGARGELYPEDYLVPMASRRCGRPVKWIEDRRENLISANHSRDITCEVELAADREGHILGIRATVQGDLGAYVRTNGGVVPSKAAQFLPGPYRIPAFSCLVQALVTNKTPVGTLRGPGRFEANFCRERMIDLMATDLGMDPAQARLRNLLKPEELPYRIGELVPGDTDATFDAGNYGAALERLLEELDYFKGGGLRQTVDDRGRFLGLGLACFVESSAAGPPEGAIVAAKPNGLVEIRTGASSLGQGTETALAQICAEVLEISIDRISVLHGSTNLLPFGGGTFHSRNTVMAGNATRIAAEKLKTRAVEIAALRWNVSAENLLYSAGVVLQPNDKKLSLSDLAEFNELCSEGTFDNQGKISWSYGAHAALVAVDPETGKIEVLRYTLTEEVGRVLNPAMLSGQAIGGVVQGIGGTLLDHMVYDSNGQLLTATLADYLLPTCDVVPRNITAIALEDAPSQLNPMGFKGAGEGGIVAVAGAIANAVCSALRDYRINITQLPLTPAVIYGLINEAKKE